MCVSFRINIEVKSLVRTSKGPLRRKVYFTEGKIEYKVIMEKAGSRTGRVKWIMG